MRPGIIDGMRMGYVDDFYDQQRGKVRKNSKEMSKNFKGITRCASEKGAKKK